MNKIDKKIVGYKVVQQEEAKDTETILDGTEKIDLTQTKRNEAIDVDSLQKLQKKELKRPLRLDNEWRLKPPYAEHALYVRLNAIEYEGKKYLYEIFFNTKDVTQVEWINALTLTLSIAFRTAIETGTSLQPLIDNLKETFGTRGSYLSKVPSKPKFVNGLVAEIGLVIEEFNNECIAWNYRESTHERPPTKEEETAAGAYEALRELDSLDYEKAGLVTTLFQVAKVTNPCPECGEQLSLLDGCLTCVQGCGYSKCG